MMDIFQPKSGWIEVITGVMHAGKSELLIHRIRRVLIAEEPVQIFKSMLDNRYEGMYRVCSHNQVCVNAEPVSDSSEILAKLRPETRVVAIDEVQFLDDGIVDVANELANRGLRVICAGTDMTFTGAPFGPMGALMCVAEKVEKLNAICATCHANSATRNQRLLNGAPAPSDGPTILVGAGDSYESRCRRCHEVPLPSLP